MRRTPRASARESAGDANRQLGHRDIPYYRTRVIACGEVAMASFSRGFIWLFIAATLGGSAVAAQSAASAIAGAVSVPAPDGQPFVVPGVTLTLTCDGREPRIEISDGRGEFKFAEVPSGMCVLTAELQ